MDFRRQCRQQLTLRTVHVRKRGVGQVRRHLVVDAEWPHVPMTRFGGGAAAGAQLRRWLAQQRRRRGEQALLGHGPMAGHVVVVGGRGAQRRFERRRLGGSGGLFAMVALADGCRRRRCSGCDVMMVVLRIAAAGTLQWWVGGGGGDDVGPSTVHAVDGRPDAGGVQLGRVQRHVHAFGGQHWLHWRNRHRLHDGFHWRPLIIGYNDRCHRTVSGRTVDQLADRLQWRRRER